MGFLYHTSHCHASFTTLPSSSLIIAQLTSSKWLGGSNGMHAPKIQQISLSRLFSSATVLDRQKSCRDEEPWFFSVAVQDCWHVSSPKQEKDAFQNFFLLTSCLHVVWTHVPYTLHLLLAVSQLGDNCIERNKGKQVFCMTKQNISRRFWSCSFSIKCGKAVKYRKREKRFFRHFLSICS